MSSGGWMVSARNIVSLAALLPAIAFSFTVSCSDLHRKSVASADDRIKNIFQKYRLSGSFAYLRRLDGKLHIVNPDLVGEGRLPCSTFKIANSIIALEEGLLLDEHEVVKWDGVVRSVPAWNADQDMAAAFQHSTVWFYQALARRLSIARYREWLSRFHIGNDDLSAGLDQFWLGGNFRVSHEDQIRLLQAIDGNTLPASRRSIAAVKRMMIVEKTNHHILRAKTGLGRDVRIPSLPIGWWVGYVEAADDRFFFSSFVTSDEDGPDFAKRRVDAVREILVFMGVL